MNGVEVLRGDCLTELAHLPDKSIHAICVDPPYGLARLTTAAVAETISGWVTGDRACMPSGRGFGALRWDQFVPPPAVWDVCLRVLKPGGWLLAFAGTRTQDLMGLSLRLAGFEQAAFACACSDTREDTHA